MTIAVIIRDNIVENVIIADEYTTAPDGCVLMTVPESVPIGSAYDPVTEVFTPPTPPVIVPEKISARQARLLLLQQGLLDEVEAMIATQSQEVQITWQFATEFYRDNPLLNSLADTLTPPLTSEQIDEFFILASEL